VWQGRARAFGETTEIVNAVLNPLRFPGQYEDGETGLFYNYFRYYDAGIGRYVTSDPIRLSLNEINTYIYSNNNSANYFDNLGLFCVYYQSTGIYSCYDTNSQDSGPYLTGKVYSGKYDPNIGFDARNDELWEQVPNWVLSQKIVIKLLVNLVTLGEIWCLFLEQIPMVGTASKYMVVINKMIQSLGRHLKGV